MKNFSQILQQQQQKIANPFVYATPEVQQQITLGILSKVSKLIVGSTVATILTAPLQTIVTSMQLSVLPHKQIYSSVQSRTKQLTKMNTQLTIAEKRKLQLMIRSGGQFQPYIAPVYEGYQQAIRNIAKQGWQAFFKGLTFRILHTMPHFLCYGAFFKQLNENNTKTFGFTSFFGKALGLLFLTDWSLNMFHVLQNRYVLQNSIKQFRVFRNVIRVIGKMITRGQIFKGVSYHALNGFIELCLKFPIFMVLFTAQKFTSTMVGVYYLSELLIYPVQTAYKRFICQSTVIPGMIPTRYSSVGHALKVIAFQQKIFGLYKGFGLHSINIMVKLVILQIIFQNFQIIQSGEF